MMNTGMSMYCKMNDIMMMMSKMTFKMMIIDDDNESFNDTVKCNTTPITAIIIDTHRVYCDDRCVNGNRHGDGE